MKEMRTNSGNVRKPGFWSEENERYSQNLDA
jgi:hypothetical protein